MARINRSKTLYKVIGIVLLFLLFVGAFFGYRFWTKSAQEKTYNRANEEMQKMDYEAAIEDYYYLGDYKDSKEQLELARKYKKYNDAIALYNKGDFEKAKVLFEELGEFEDSKKYALLCSIDDYNELQEKLYEEAMTAMDNGDYEGAKNSFSKIEHYKDSKNKLEECDKNIWRRCLATSVSAGSLTSIGIGPERLLTAGNFRYGQDSLEWDNLISISTSQYYTVGVYDNGTARVAGKIDWYNDLEKKEISNVIEGVAAYDYVAFLLEDGTVWGEGYDNEETYKETIDFSGWENVIDIDAGHHLIAGVSMDGRIFVTGRNAQKIKEEIEKNQDKWKNVYRIAVGGGSSADDGFVVGLRKDKKVVVAGNCDAGVSNAEKWSDIIDISAGDYHVVGLTSDGRVEGAININSELKRKDAQSCCDFSLLSNIKFQSIEAGNCTSLLVSENGTVYVCGYDHQGQVPKSEEWKGIPRYEYSFLEYIKSTE